MIIGKSNIKEARASIIEGGFDKEGGHIQISYVSPKTGEKITFNANGLFGVINSQEDQLGATAIMGLWNIPSLVEAAIQVGVTMVEEVFEDGGIEPTIAFYHDLVRTLGERIKELDEASCTPPVKPEVH